MSKRSDKNLKRKKKVEKHREFLQSLGDKYEKPYIQRQRLLPGSIYLNWVLNGDKEEKDGNMEGN